MLFLPFSKDDIFPPVWCLSRHEYSNDFAPTNDVVITSYSVISLVHSEILFYSFFISGYGATHAIVRIR